jgi:26S proteasome regulatory subunit T3
VRLPRTCSSALPVANRRRYIHLQEEYIKDEQRSLKRELVRAQEEIKRIQSVPLVIGQFMEAIDQK